MASTTLTPQLERELADLQRRAYGPDADIHLDATALARLRELEALSQTVSSASVGAYVEPAETAPIRSEVQDEPGDEPAAPRSTAPVTHDPAPTQADPPPVSVEPQRDRATPRPESPRAWWRRARTWLLLGVGVVVGALIVVAVLWASSRPDATLPVVDGDVSSLNSDSYLEYLEIEPDALRSHGTYGSLGVWTGPTTRGLTCLLLTIGISVWDQSCTPAGIDPLVDVTLFAGDFAAQDLELPERSVVRFVAKGDVVEVWIAVPSEPAPEPDSLRLLL